jgi:hypothetical protein
MNRRILLGVAFTLALAFPWTSASAQAAAETVLLTGSSATAGVKAGSALGSALSRATSHIAESIPQPGAQSATQRVPQTGTRPGAAISETSTFVAGTPPDGPVIASIQGAAASCNPTQPVSTPASKTATEAPPANCPGQASASKPAPQKYRSVITLPAAK